MKQVYFIRRIDGTGPIKIGCSAYLEKRIYQLGIDYRATFALLASVPGNYVDERALHLKFASIRAHVEGPKGPVVGATEWFEPTPELLAFIERVATTGKLIFKIEERRDLIFAKRYLNGETLQQIADDYGLTRERVRQVLRKAGVPSLGLRPEHKQTPHALGPDEIAAVNAYRGGELPSSICVRFGIARYQLLAACRRLGIEIRRPGAPCRTDHEIVCKKLGQLYHQGASLCEIRDEFGWSHVTYVYRWLQRAGVKPNRRGDLARQAA